MREEQIGSWTVRFFEESEAKIYCIRSVETGLPVYVGSTTRPVRHRIRNHSADVKKGSDLPVHVWMRSQKSFSVEILEVCDESERHKREAHWVAAFDGLLNLTDGGPGKSGYKFKWSPEQRQAMFRSEPVVCQTCNKAFRKKQSQVKRTEHNFCSRDCYQDWLRLERIEGRR